MPADTALHTAPASSPTNDRIRAGLKRGWRRFMIAREISALREAGHHVRDSSMFDDRIEELRREVAAL